MLTFSAVAKVWLSRTVGTINFTASPCICSWKMESFLLRAEAIPGMRWFLDAAVWHFSLPHLGEMSVLVDRKNYRCKPLLWKWCPECFTWLQDPKCDSDQCVEFPVAIGSKRRSPSISSASTMTLISAQQLTRTDLVHSQKNCQKSKNWTGTEKRRVFCQHKVLFHYTNAFEECEVEL